MYIKLKDLYDTKPHIFVLGVDHLLNVGFKMTETINDEGIAKIKGENTIPKEILQEIVRTSKQIADACDNRLELIEFCSLITREQGDDIWNQTLTAK